MDGDKVPQEKAPGQSPGKHRGLLQGSLRMHIIPQQGAQGSLGVQEFHGRGFCSTLCPAGTTTPDSQRESQGQGHGQHSGTGSRVGALPASRFPTPPGCENSAADLQAA